eukprot:Gregarina_sp_Poly_1__2610@NODE_1709_length_3503_cov_129_177532_g1119_i0_p2_GENE_NODE_1709_length_3503_cov_129_177532_g1119_i0NODE_1709_length_3503_cov_129_177532_g1119_i0_p2_ORF_typecomplete_len192_score51_01Elf1/PF05129_13/9_7e25Rubredoxin/PF00301_20/1_4Rubredoxin/PF00301_20/1_5e02Rubredoxin/PF00301_20/2_5e03_NODE_1709_length_3503_cov_129_177532_g1119_i027113286
MGKRKPRRRAPTRAPAPKLDSEFDCPFCAALKSVQVQIKKRELVAQLHCRACNVDYQTGVGPLDEPVDVFSLWIDSCEEVNMPNKGHANTFIPQREVSRREPAVSHHSKKRRVGEEDEGGDVYDLPEEEEEEVEEEATDEHHAEEELGDEIEFENFDDDEGSAAAGIETIVPDAGPSKRKLTKRWNADDDD